MTIFHPIPVWSRNQRIIHWTIAFAVLIIIPLGLFIFASDTLDVPEEGVDSIIDLHASIGFVLAAGVIARLIYLFKGPKTSRWQDVLPHKKADWKLAWSTLSFYFSGFKGKAPVYLSHNPLAGIADIVLFVFLTTQALSGATLFYHHEFGDENASGAPAGRTHQEGSLNGADGAINQTHAESWSKDLSEYAHVVGAVIIILFVLAHFSALGLHDAVEERGLVSSMISGNKFFSEEEIKELSNQIKEKSLKKDIS